MYDDTIGSAARAPGGFSAFDNLIDRVSPASGLVLRPGDLLISPEFFAAPGLVIDYNGAVNTPGTIAAADIFVGDASLSNEIRLASYDRVRDNEISDRNFKREHSIPASAFDAVLPPGQGGTGRASVPLHGVAGLQPVVGDQGGRASASDCLVVESIGAESKIGIPGDLKIFPDLAAMDSGGGHHVLSNVGGQLAASHSDAGTEMVPLLIGAGGAAKISDERRPRLGPFSFERLSYTEARYSATASPGTAPLSNVRVAKYGALGSDPRDAERPRGPFEVLSGLSPLPYGQPPSLPDDGLDLAESITVQKNGGAFVISETAVPERDHRAVRATAEDDRGNLSEVEEFVWDTVPPLAASVTQPAYAGLTVSFAASNVPRPHHPGSRAGADSGPTLVRSGLFYTNLLTAEVPGFSNSVGRLGEHSLPHPGGLSKSNADSLMGPAVAWALWDTLSNASSALEQAAPLVEIAEGASSNLSFKAKTHLIYDGGAGEWRAADNGYSKTYKPFVLLGDSYSNFKLHLFEKEYVYIPNPDVPVTFLSFAGDGRSVTVQYQLLDNLVDVVARVFPLTALLGSDSNAEPGDASGAGSHPDQPDVATYQLSNTTGFHQATFGDLHHTTFYRLVVETLDLAGFYRRDYYDFHTADFSDPVIRLDASSVDADGVVSLSWTAADSNDGGIAAVHAFSGPDPPAIGEQALRLRLDSAEPRYTFDGILPAYRTEAGGKLDASVSVTGALFSNAADAHHISHYVQLVAEDTAAQFHAPSNNLAATDYGAEVPFIVSTTSGSQLTAPYGNQVSLYSVALEADTVVASAFLVGLSEEAAALLFRAGGSGSDAAAASNLWSLVEANSNIFAPAIKSDKLFGMPV